MPKFPYTVGEEVELTDAEPKSDDRFVVILEIDRAKGRFRGEHEDESDEWFSFNEVVGRGRCPDCGAPTTQTGACSIPCGA